MDYVKPSEVVKAMVEAGAAKGALPIKDLLIRGFLSGALLAFASSLAITASIQTGMPIVGALIFPVGFVMIVVLGLELATGSFAVLPLACIERRLGTGTMLANLCWVLLGNLLGSVVYALLLTGSLTSLGHVALADNGIGPAIIKATEARTLGFAKLGMAGWWTAFLRGVLCNWMVCLGVVMGLASTSTAGKIVGAWLPILTFYALGYEHSIVNMFLFPAGILLGAKVTVTDWMIWNEIPVTLGNALGGFVFTGLALYATYRPTAATPVSARLHPAAEPAEELLPSAR